MSRWRRAQLVVHEWVAEGSAGGEGLSWWCMSGSWRAQQVVKGSGGGDWVV